jgi:hypothetical protein
VNERTPYVLAAEGGGVTEAARDARDAFHVQVTKAIVRYMSAHPDEGGDVHVRILLLVALLYEDHLSGGHRANEVLRALGR